LGLLENTAVIFTTDHGTYLGEHGYVGKREHLYEEVAHIPLVIRPPDSEGIKHGRCNAIVQSPDLMPTILDMAGLDAPPTVQGKSVLPAIKNEKEWNREIAVSSPTLAGQSLPSWITVTSKKWALLASLNKMSQTGKVEPELYNLSRDPGETCNVYNERTDIAKTLRRSMIEFLRALGTNEDTLSQYS